MNFLTYLNSKSANDNIATHNEIKKALPQISTNASPY